jgi:hypothetical protein
MLITHRPKGRMCINCVRMLDHSQCPKTEDFKAMPVIGVDKEDGMIVVRCTKFERGRPIEETT